MAYTAAQLRTLYTSVHFGLEPGVTQQAILDSFASANAAGTLSDAQTLAGVIDTADADSAVAIGSYQFFTGKSPTQAGISFLVNSTANPNDLNDPYYAQFNQTNRYINFAQNLGILGEGQLTFQALYGSMSFGAAVAAFYESIIGASQATSAGINPTAAIADIASRLPYFTAVAAERFPTMNQDLAIKAALVGYIMSEAMKANVGKFAVATANMLSAVSAGTATYNTDILTTYSTTTPPTSGGGTTPPPSGSFPTSPTAPASNTNVDLSTGNVTLATLAPNPGATVQVGHATNMLTLSLNDASGSSDVVSVTLATTAAAVGGNLGGVTARLAAQNVEKMNLTSSGVLAGTGANNVVNLDPALSSFARIDIFGAAPLTLNTGAYLNSIVLNGGGATGGLTINASAVNQVNVATHINGGSANDTLSPATLVGAGSVNQTIYGGGGGDVINLGATHSQIDTLAYRAATDSQYDVTNTAGASGTATANTGKMDNVNNFKTGQDKLDFSAFGFNAVQAQIVDKGAQGTTGTMETLAATPTFFQDAGITRSFAQVHVGPDTYLYVDTNKDGVYSSADMVVKFVGVALLANADVLR